MNATSSTQKVNSDTEVTTALKRLRNDLEKLKQIEKRAARRTLNDLDRLYPPSKERTELRTKILDTLAWYRQQIASWLEQQTLQSLETD